MTRRRRAPEPFDRSIESALRPGQFIGYGKSFSFIKELDRLAKQVDPLVDDEPDRAAGVYETFLAGCYAKTGEVNDSGGGFGSFMQTLCCRWVRARQAGGHPAEETVDTLVRWMDADGYGYTYRIERDLAEVLDDAGRRAFVQLARARFEQASKEAERREGEPGGDASRRHWADVLRAFYGAQQDSFSYIRLCRQMGIRGEDCLAIADLFHVDGETRQALSWVQKGLEITGRHGFRAYDLGRRERALLVELGRPEEALKLAWQNFQASPGSAGYEELMKYAPQKERAAWHERAMTRAETGDAPASFDLFLEERETKRLVDRVGRASDEELTDVGRYTLRDVAKYLTRTHPDVAARLFRLMGLEIVEEGKSKHYPSALSLLKRAKACYERAGMVSEWEALVKNIRERHRRKSAFLPKFEKLVRGESEKKPENEPSFLDAAKKAWPSGRAGH